MSNDFPRFPPTVEPPKKPKTVPIILGSCALLCLLCCGGVGALFLLGSRAKDDAKINAERFLTAFEHSDYTAISPLLARQAGTVEALKDVSALLQKRHGKFKGHTGPTGFNAGNYNGASEVRLGYSEQFEKGSVPFLVTMVSEDGSWKVLSFHSDL